MVVASLSRAGWLSLGVAVIVLGFRELDFRSMIRKHPKTAAVVCILLVVAAAGIFFLKKESALGRFHIWNMELRAIMEYPFTGTGHGTALGAYGMAQADYFAAQERHPDIVRIAGCPEYAFNEYLRVGMEYGIPAMILAICAVLMLIVFLLHRRSPLSYGIIAFAVFAFFSYPLEAFGNNTKDAGWTAASYLSGAGLYDEAVQEYETLYDEFHDNYRFLYDYGYALHLSGRYEASTAILAEGARMSSDPMFHNIMGKNHEASGDFAKAENEYLLAHYMVPCRLYPLVENLMVKVILFVMPF